MIGLYEVPVNTPQNIFPNCFVCNTDPLTLFGAEFISTGKRWIKTEADASPFGAILATYMRDGANWVQEAQGSGGGTFQPDGVISGGEVVHTGGLNFTVSPAAYVIGGAVYQSPQTNLTLAAADPTNPRIDVFALTTSGTAVVVAGTASATPAEPDVDPITQLQISFALVAAGATSPTGVTTTNVYLENAGTGGGEWAATSAASINPNSTADPFAGTKSVEATNAVSGDHLTLTPAADYDINDEQLLIFRIKSKAAWASTRSLRVFARVAGIRVGSAVFIKPTGTFGFVSSNVTDDQQISIPITNFKIPFGTLIDDLRFTVGGTGTGIGFFIDNIILQRGTVPTEPGSDLEGRVEALEADVVTIEADIAALEAADVSLDGRLDTVETDLNAAEATIADHETRIDALEATPVPTPVKTETASYTPVLADANKLIGMDVATANDFTIPPNASVAYPVGTELHPYQRGVGQTTIVAGAGVTIRVSATFTLALAAQWAIATVKKLGTNEWLAFGDLEAA